MDSTAETSVKSYRQMVIENKNEFQKNSRNTRNVNINKNALAARKRVCNEKKHELQVTHPLENMQKAKMNELIYLTNNTKKKKHLSDYRIEKVPKNREPKMRGILLNGNIPKNLTICGWE
ncbi:hypothetical protein WA026_021867 [Henosepilachna vigintioctopunctata]|uniref:Uncharacterized protein n=1 Tax=Henosepilachna vigintioctopunctata TaxID=420089 RepID=A0AAW1UJ26_9CUCU